MPKMIILRGVSGSGKSTWARMYAQNTGAIVVSRDSIRHDTLGIPSQDYYQAPREVIADREAMVSRLQDASIIAVLRAGKDVIVDNTNTEWKYVKALAKIAERNGAEVEIKVFDVKLPVAIAADRHRRDQGGRYVGEAVIRKQHDRFQGNKHLTLEPAPVVKPYTGTPGKPKAFLVDIDGTLAHMRNYRGPYDWAKVGLDDVDEVIAEIVELIAIGAQETAQHENDFYEVIVMSGRDESCRNETITWLHKHGIVFDYLFMRPEKDMRPDNIIKAELFDKFVRDNFNVRFVLDDRNQVVDMWRAMGLKTLQVEPGDF